jgi:uncharacterized protein YjgD (DUF1641 family)
VGADTDHAIALNEATAAAIDSAAGDLAAATARYTKWASDADKIVALEQELQLGEAQDAHSAAIDALTAKVADAQEVLDQSSDKVADNATRESLSALIGEVNEITAADVPRTLETVKAATDAATAKAADLQSAVATVNDSVAAKTAADAAAAAAAKASTHSSSKSSSSGTSGGRSTAIGDGGTIWSQGADGLWYDQTANCNSGFIDCTYTAP